MSNTLILLAHPRGPQFANKINASGCTAPQVGPTVDQTLTGEFVSPQGATMPHAGDRQHVTADQARRPRKEGKE